jgi:hypothetical protein
LQEFKHGVGYLQQKTGVAVLPLYLRGTYRSLPKGAALPNRRNLTAVIGPLISADFLEKRCDGLNRAEAYGEISNTLYSAILALRDGTPYPWNAAAESTRSDDGLETVFEELSSRFLPAQLVKPTTWYFSLGDKADGKWTLRVTPDGAEASPGRPQGGAADCVLKTDIRTFMRIVKEGYVPGFSEFTDGTVKTNDPNLLMQFKSTFGL